MRPALIAAWWADCLAWRGRLLVGRQWHWCADWDDLPMDETCPEWPCACVGGSGPTLTPEALRAACAWLG